MVLIYRSMINTINNDNRAPLHIIIKGNKFHKLSLFLKEHSAKTAQKLNETCQKNNCYL